MTDIITTGNEKGGVGKTTTVVNLAAAFASMGKAELVTDNDPQGNASELLGVERGQVEPKSLAQAIFDRKSFEDYRIKSNIEGVDLIAGTPLLKQVQVPILIIHGLDDPLFPVDHGYALETAIPNSKLLIIENMGHALNRSFQNKIVNAMATHMKQNEKNLSNPCQTELG